MYLCTRKYKHVTYMIKKVNGHVVKCYRCSSEWQFDESDVQEKECSYGLVSYAGETYMKRYIVCPKCGDELEVR